jgi:acetylornithine/N-succinyldiaminopimelate aminotransferase
LYKCSIAQSRSNPAIALSLQPPELIIMPHLKNIFFKHLAQTSPKPLALDIISAAGIYMTDRCGKKYMDLISGISVSSLGHSHPAIIAAIRNQLDRHLHLMVYGEFIQQSQLELVERLTSLLPAFLNTAYLVNSGSEAVEGALKLAKRYTGRSGIVAFKNAYHGSTHGALSVTGSPELQMRYRPLLPGITHLDFNNIAQLELISHKTACVIIEPVQGEAGIIPADKDFLKALREKCTQAGALLIFDEIQTGMGRTGKMFAFENYEVVPDILLLAKAFGGGLPLGAFISSSEIMHCLTHDPVLGHISTFGGHPLSCAAALAAIEIIISEKLTETVEDKAAIIIHELAALPQVVEIRHLGLMMAVQFKDEEFNKKVIEKCLGKGLITDWFLFRDDALRIAPPLVTTMNEAKEAATLIREAILGVMQ